ncbi:trypsin-like serine protease [Sorangium sp. So ce1389]|uniref:trypsin-like serine protease n=1 Tax=Sorangium sp. So ce1389 TaxID=3133336 RepID=UPI003F5E36CD
MRTMFALSAAALLAGCVVDSQPDSELIDSSQDQLVNGHVATEAEYPSTVHLGGCTGVKVGPRHFLSAAHCFSNPGSVTQLNVTPDNNALNPVALTVVSVNNHPEYQNCTSCAGDNSMSDFGLKPDVSLIIVNELTPQIPVAVIDPNPVQDGTSVTLTGYGCEGVTPPPPTRFKVGDSTTVSPLTFDPATTIPGGYTTTAGPAVVPGAPALCPGDSGGPLFRTGTNLVVGINALVSGNDDGEIGNWFTRVDLESRYNVHAWLQGLIGAPVGTPCSSICSNPTPITSVSYSSGNLGTGERCFESTANSVNVNCGGFASSRTFDVNGTAISCNGQGITLPAKRNGGYCFHASAGNNSWAWFTTW